MLLHEFVMQKGLEEVRAVFADEAAAIAGPKGRHRSDRTANHWGEVDAEFVLGGRKVSIARPRVRSADRKEVALPSVALFASRDPLNERVVSQLLLGVSTRRYNRSLERLEAPARTRGTSKSAVSRTFVAATRRRVEEELTRSLESLDLAVLMLDGIVVKGQRVVVALGVDVIGNKHVLGLRMGSTENAILCTEFLQDLLKRGMKVSRPLLCVIDGGGGLRRALHDVFGDQVLIQRCQVHKMRNVKEHLPEKAQAWVISQMRDAYKASSATAARRQLQRLVAWLDRNGHDDAAGSLREGLEETLTTLKLQLPLTLTRSLSTTNAIENLMSSIRRTTHRVSRWRNGSMIRRWVGIAILEAQKTFRRLKGHRELPLLVEALGRLHVSSLAASSDAA
ncbi:MAG: IS256 family transposase [Terriglobales bacterium]